MKKVLQAQVCFSINILLQNSGSFYLCTWGKSFLLKESEVCKPTYFLLVSLIVYYFYRDCFVNLKVDLININS